MAARNPQNLSSGVHNIEICMSKPGVSGLMDKVGDKHFQLYLDQEKKRWMYLSSTLYRIKRIVNFPKVF